MACSNWRLVGGPVPPVDERKGGSIKRPVILATKRAQPLPIQVRREEDQNLQASKTIIASRRNTMLYMTAEILGGFALLSGDPAEARVGRLENRKKVMEKLGRLREKAGVSEPKTENGINAPSGPPSAKEKKLPTFPLPPPPTNPQNGPIGPLVEATLP